VKIFFFFFCPASLFSTYMIVHAQYEFLEHFCLLCFICVFVLKVTWVSFYLNRCSLNSVIEIVASFVFILMYIGSLSLLLHVSQKLFLSNASWDIWQLKQEIAALEELSRQLFLEAHDMHIMQERLQWASTFQGKYFNFLGYFFSLYCTWKIFIVSSVF